MEIGYRGKTLEINDARIMFRNFEGRVDKFNKNGERNFAVIIPNEDIANELIEAGWNVKIRPPRTPDEAPFIYLQVKVNFNGRGPSIYVQAGNGPRKKLNENNVKMLDEIDIQSVSMDINPYNWNVNGDSGIAAYLESMLVIQNVDRFAAQDNADELPF